MASIIGDRHITVHHVGSVVAQEHIVSYDIRTDLQFYHRIRFGGRHRGTVSTQKNSASDNGLLGLCSCYTDRDLFSIGTERIEGIDGRRAWIIIEIAVNWICLIFSFVGIRIRAVTTAIDVTSDRCIDTYRIATIDLTRNIITTINIIDISASHQYTCRQTYTFREQIAFQIGSLSWMSQIASGDHIGLATATVDIINLDFRVCQYLQKKSISAGHISFVSTTVKVTDLSFSEEPLRTDGHISLIVATENPAKLEIRT